MIKPSIDRFARRQIGNRKEQKCGCCDNWFDRDKISLCNLPEGMANLCPGCKAMLCGEAPPEPDKDAPMHTAVSHPEKHDDPNGRQIKEPVNLDITPEEMMVIDSAIRQLLANNVWVYPHDRYQKNLVKADPRVVESIRDKIVKTREALWRHR